ncbi:hypothetical protein [Desulfuribacillus stibiiarsenatis]|uniref:hypothetical protein n=1 Tax=Desulfuribacillus stibiiarsenatis TaxID=1390249 RepID=UPI001C407BE9|nr:hypothetical protein [Desulfuribacillus stibiiarsenatis]
MSAMLLVMLLTGCADIQVSLNPDGSGKATYTIATGSLIPPEEVKKELEKEIAKINTEVGKQVIKVNSISTKNNAFTANLEFENVTQLDKSYLLVTVEDFMDYKPSLLNNLKDQNNNNVSKDELEKYKDYALLNINNFDKNSVGLVITLPSNVEYMSEGVLFVDGKKNKIRIDGRNTIVIYKAKGSNIINYLIAILLIVAGYFIYRKYVAHKTEDKLTEGGVTNE